MSFNKGTIYHLEEFEVELLDDLVSFSARVEVDENCDAIFSLELPINAFMVMPGMSKVLHRNGMEWSPKECSIYDCDFFTANPSLMEIEFKTYNLPCAVDIIPKGKDYKKLYEEIEHAYGELMEAYEAASLALIQSAKTYIDSKGIGRVCDPLAVANSWLESELVSSRHAVESYQDRVEKLTNKDNVDLDHYTITKPVRIIHGGL